MNFHLTSAVIFIAFFANKCVESASQKEVCPCVPLNVCPEISHFKNDDEKYLTTILKCSESGFVRCCSESDRIKLQANRRSDDDLTDTIFIGDSSEEETTTTEKLIDITTVGIDDNSISETTTELINEITTDFPNEISNTLNDVDNYNKSTNVELVYPDQSEDKNDGKFNNENLFLIYPNNDDLTAARSDSTLMNFVDRENIEFTTATNLNEETTEIDPPTTTPNIEVATTIANNEEKPIQQKRKRVVIKKRLRKKLVDDSLEGAESKISKTLVKPTKNVEESTSPATTTKKKKVRKILKTRSTTIDPNSLTSTTTTQTPLTIKPRKILYDTKRRTNFLKKTPNQIQHDDEDDDDGELSDMTVTLPPIAITTSSTEASTTSTSTTSQPTTTTTTTTPRTTRKTTTTQVASKRTTPLFTTTTTKKSLPKVIQQANRIDLEHKTMIKTLHKALSAIHSGVDMANVEKMIENHRVRMDEIRKNPPISTPTRPYRGSAKFNRPTTIRDYNYNFHDSSRTRNISRPQRITTTTTVKPVERITMRKSPRLAITQPPTPPPTHHPTNFEFKALELPSNAAPNEFRPSQLYGITMDESHQLDIIEIEKIYKTHEPPKSLQNGFFPVIENGTPSTIL